MDGYRKRIEDMISKVALNTHGSNRIGKAQILAILELADAIRDGTKIIGDAARKGGKLV